MFTRQFYYYQAMKNFGTQWFKTRWIPSDADRLAADIKNLSGVALASTYWEPYVEYSSTLYYNYLYSHAIAGNCGASVSTPGVSFYGNSNPKNYGCTTVIGGGDTTPTLDDYALESLFSSGLSKQVAHSDVFYDAENDKWYVDETTVFTRIQDEAITVKEWGIYGATHKNGTTASHMCLYRELLPVPITLNRGDALKLTVRYSMDAHAAIQEV